MTQKIKIRVYVTKLHAQKIDEIVATSELNYPNRQNVIINLINGSESLDEMLERARRDN